MQFNVSAAALLALAAQVLAQVADFDPVLTPTKWQEVPAGQRFDITWQAKPKYSGEKISISLIGGDTQDTQTPIETIATGIDNDAATYSWTIDSNLGDKNVYGLVLKLESDPKVFQYSFPFKITGGKARESPSRTQTDVPAPEPTKAAVYPSIHPVVTKTHPIPAVCDNSTISIATTVHSTSNIQQSHQPSTYSQPTPTVVIVSSAARFITPIVLIACLLMVPLIL
ncbi:hypothetical protein H9Q70_013261 [Fusarium xylarioides]|nr:hypothetical protein H9Q70_013261 [Fusarium xylarioides]KAG5769951.1 hypothetical protein H9Q73_013380 [Fusarium xylarioides]